jgi:hypothetical protein
MRVFPVCGLSREEGRLPSFARQAGPKHPLRRRGRRPRRESLATRAEQVACSVGRGSRRVVKGGVRVGDAKQLFCIRPAMEAFADE